MGLSLLTITAMPSFAKTVAFGGVGGPEFQGCVGVHGLIRFDQFFHQRGNRGGTANHDLACGLGAGVISANIADVTFLGGQGLTVGAHAVSNEVHGNGVGSFAVRNHPSRCQRWGQRLPR